MNVIIVILVCCMILNVYSLPEYEDHCNNAQKNTLHSCQVRVDNNLVDECMYSRTKEMYRSLCHINWPVSNIDSNYTRSIFHFNSARIWKLTGDYDSRIIKYFVDYQNMYENYLMVKEIIKSSIFDAFQRWGDNIRLKFYETDDETEAEIFIRFPGKIDKNGTYPVSSVVMSTIKFSRTKINGTIYCINYEKIQTAVIEIANVNNIEFNRLFYMIKAEDIRRFKYTFIKSEYYSIFNDMINEDKVFILFYKAILHEIGKVLGIDYIDEEVPSLMQSSDYKEIYDIQDVDIDAIRCLYGLPLSLSSNKI